MTETHSHIFYPSTLNELISIKNQNPEAVLWAGGTGLMGKETGKVPRLPLNIIQLSRISELKKIRRTERFLEIGSGAVINKILNVGQHVLPLALAEAMKLIRPSAIRNRATIGGNICMPDTRLNLFSILFLMDASLELRGVGGTRWIQINRLFNKSGEIQLKDNEILTRIRIPFGNWNRQFFKNDGNPFLNEKKSISFAVLADIRKGMLNDFRMAIGNSGKQIIRNIELESLIIGKKVPLSTKEISAIGDFNKNWMETLTSELTPFQRERASRFLFWFLEELLP